MMDPTLLKKLDRLTTFPTNDSYKNQPKTAAGIHVKPFATTACLFQLRRVYWFIYNLAVSCDNHLQLITLCYTCTAVRQAGLIF